MAKSSEATDRGWKVKAINDDRITQVHKNLKHIPERMNARIEMRAEKQGLCCLQTDTICIKSAIVSVCLLSPCQ